ncbi:putative RNA methyltransferase YpsC [[Clostridium] cellulosi]|uniref:Putative RNA methyltransferase YpsC n=1 Tax=[Clostridium] cellulosi TaxID=29343 RepID=A0A078KM98_9FIRM|nr:MAG: class I SAM-dependent RNA methyltransferase [[Clostridium] cellulosi]CDZ23593.1 putative RNA methyltransferase YpsC [[Clostridium] cellulosi]
MDKVTLACPCLFGVESLVADEIKALGYNDVETQNGRVIFHADESAIARANIWLRCAERVLIMLGEFEAHSFEDLFQGVKAIPWEKWIGRDDAFPVKGWSLNSKLHSVPDCQAIIKKAIVEHLKEKYHVTWFKETGAKFQIQFSILKDKVSIYIDTSGEGLHKRGYRRNSIEAPLKETLAASMVKIARFYADRAFCDPMCGSGTILIEAALIGRNIAPGLNRSFAAENFHLDKSIWKDAREEASAAINSEPIEVFGYDIDQKAVELTLENAKKAGVGDVITASRQDLRDFAPTQEHGTVVTNPPYGERLLDIKAAEEIYKTMGSVFLKLKGWRFYIISPSENFESLFGKRADKKRKLYNGMIKCEFFQYFRR